MFKTAVLWRLDFSTYRHCKKSTIEHLHCRAQESAEKVQSDLSRDVKVTTAKEKLKVLQNKPWSCDDTDAYSLESTVMIWIAVSSYSIKETIKITGNFHFPFSQQSSSRHIRNQIEDIQNNINLQ